MKLLFDQNLSYRLVDALSDVFTSCQHVREAGLSTANDWEIWEYARRENLIIVTKDVDFHQRSFLLGFPPKVVWLRLGNCSTADVEAVLRGHVEDIERFAADEVEALLVLARG